MATTQEDFDTNENMDRGRKKDNAESIDAKRSSSKENVDNGENQVANGMQSSAPQPGIATVGNIGAESSE